VALVLGSMMLIRTPEPYMRISLPVILSSAGVMALFFGLVVGAGVRALHARTTTGREGLIGEVAVVRHRLAPRGQVFVEGELWNAEADVPVEEGRTVRVAAVEGLTLKVVPIQDLPASTPAKAGSEQ
jgi:membrane-bound serine protease (ClpP class)